MMTNLLRSIQCDSAAFAQLSSLILKEGKSIHFKARGGSMHPLVRDGDYLLIKPVDPRLIRKGDVILCKSEAERVVAHRVIRIAKAPAGSRFLVQGDQAPEPDGWIEESDVFGKLVLIERDGNVIDMQSPSMKLLNQIALWRIKLHLSRFRLTRSAGRALKHMPIFCRFLA